MTGKAIAIGFGLAVIGVFIGLWLDNRMKKWIERRESDKKVH